MKWKAYNEIAYKEREPKNNVYHASIIYSH